jgi:hypothetical protein
LFTRKAFGGRNFKGTPLRFFCHDRTGIFLIFFSDYLPYGIPYGIGLDE